MAQPREPLNHGPRSAPEFLPALHSVQLNLAAVLKAICLKNEIPYFLLFGTALGAVRHKGFIPWDDDMDFGMLRSDYDRFVLSCEVELPDGYFLQTTLRDRAFGLSFAKIRKDGTLFIERGMEHPNRHQGIFVDVFPLDEVPGSRIIQRWHAASTYALKRIVLIKSGYRLGTDRGVISRIVSRLLPSVITLLPYSFTLKSLDRELRRFNGRGNRQLVALGGPYSYETQKVERAWTEDLEQREFETTSFPCFRESAEYLTRLYGDFMKLPPVSEQRGAHKLVDIRIS